MSVLTRRESHEGVERLHVSRSSPTGGALYWTSCYRTGAVMVDSGHMYARGAVRAFADEGPVDAVLATHEHEDHVGNYRLFVDRGVPAFAPKAAVDRLERIAEGRVGRRLPLYRAITWGSHDGARGARVANGVVRADGRDFRIVHTPGHSADHVAILDESLGALFTGDLVLGKLKTSRPVEDIPLQVASMRAVRELDPRAVFPAHGPILTRPRQELDDILEYMDALQRRAHALAARGRSVRHITRDLLGKEGVLTYVSAFEFSKANLIRSLLSRPPP